MVTIMKKILLVFMVIFLMIGVCGCMDTKNNKSNRKESDEEYVILMQDYIQNKYSINVEVVESILPKNGINTALKENILVVKDENGVIANVRARLGTPYNYFDDYVNSSVAFEIQKCIEISISTQKSYSKIYAVCDSGDIVEFSVKDITSLTFVSMVEGNPTDKTIEELYEIYTQIQTKGYSNTYFIVGFTDGNKEFEKVVENYKVYGKSKMEDYSGEVYSKLYITDNNVSFDEFKNSVKES